MTRVHGWTRSYGVRLALGYALVTTIIAAAWAWSLFGPLTNELERRQDSRLEGVARTAAVQLDSAQGLEGYLRRVAEAAGVRATLVAEDGRVLADTEARASAMENHLERPEIGAALAGRVGTARRVSRTTGAELLYVAVPATRDGAPVALRVSEPVRSVAAIASRARRGGLALVAVALALALALSARLARSAAAPVRELTDSARAMAEGDLGAPVPRHSGELGVLSAALDDLGAQMRSRLDALQRERSTLSTVLDGLEDAVFLLENDVVMYANRAAGAHFGEPAGGWPGHPLEAGVPASLAGLVVLNAEAGEAVTREWGPDPTGRSLRVLVAPLPPSDEARRTLVVVSDVTERARLEGMRRDFVANASHELKTPATSIQLLAESANLAASDDDLDAVRTFLAQLGTEATRLSRMVKDLLDLSRLDSGPAPGTITDVRRAVELAIAGHRRAAHEGGLALEADFGGVEGEEAYVRADPTDLAIALDNLLDNAIKYTERGGVRLTVGARAGEVRIDVSDTGIGIPAEELPRIFERFYRVDRARGRDTGGTGLGLALVRNVAERSGGYVDVVSSPGSGSTFTLRLPRAT